MNFKVAGLIGFVMVIVGMGWLMFNSIGNVIQTKSEANEAHSEVEKAQMEYDAALKACLDVEGPPYPMCKGTVIDDCMKYDGGSYEECNQQWQEEYKRVTGA